VTSGNSSLTYSAVRFLASPAVDLAKCLAAKEAAIKAITARYTGFNWQDVGLGRPLFGGSSGMILMSKSLQVSFPAVATQEIRQVMLNAGAATAAAVVLGCAPHRVNAECVVGESDEFVVVAVQIAVIPSRLNVV
jgi:phosphopantetheinyl transferase (holo-ACP synthase)